MNQNTVRYYWRRAEFVLANIHQFARINTVAFGDKTGPAIWLEEWDMDPLGVNPRTNSYAAIKSFVVPGSVFFTAEQAQSDIMGFGVVQNLTSDQQIDQYHLTAAGNMGLGAQIGDFYLALVAVLPSAERAGIFNTLAALRIAHALMGGAKRIWLQTHIENKVIRGYYSQRGFVAHSYHDDPDRDPPSPRVVMGRDIGA